MERLDLVIQNKTSTFDIDQYNHNLDIIDDFCKNYPKVIEFWMGKDSDTPSHAEYPTKYFAIEGMTWEEWVDSEYNTGGFLYRSGDANVYYPGGYIVCRGFIIATGGYVYRTDRIIDGWRYYIQSTAGGTN